MNFNNWILSIITLLFITHVSCEGSNSSEQKDGQDNEQAQLILSNLKVSINDKVGNPVISKKLTYPKPLNSILTTEEGQSYRISFTAKKKTISNDEEAIKLNLAVVLFNHTETSKLSYLPFKQSKGANYKLTLGPKKLPNFIKKNPGNYEVTLLLGGVKKVESIKYKVGKVEFKVDKLTEENKKYQFEPKPIIEHQFRQPDKIANSTLSYLFSILVLSPWLILLGLWSKLNINIKEFPFNEPTALIYSSSFIVCLSGYLILAYLYWIRLTIFDTLFCFFPLTLATIVFGKFTLSRAQAKLHVKAKN
ncbi:hypothetical protein K502DRAFT_368693 [Neoconidiobolus thromboides FSU 785]|nr:hypothetical protein K502DRAFT_368693 [Neoconidiobolus thromboides FSU 785]